MHKLHCWYFFRDSGILSLFDLPARISKYFVRCVGMYVMCAGQVCSCIKHVLRKLWHRFVLGGFLVYIVFHVFVWHHG